MERMKVEKSDYVVKKKLKWSCPKTGGAPLLTMPNIPKPMHGLAPRIIMGEAAWTKVRKKAYFDAGYRSEISGKLCAEPGSLHAHEVYDINYKTGLCTFKRVCAITPQEHVYFIHSGRMLTLWKGKNPMYTTEKVLAGVENGFKLIYEWNKTHKQKLRVYSTFLDYLSHEELRPSMEALIKKYEIEFWEEDKSKLCKWKDWKLIIQHDDGTEDKYPTPYAGPEEWEEAMKIVNKNDTIRQMNSPFVGGAFDEIDNLLKEE